MLKYKKRTFYSESQILQQVAQRGYVDLILGDIQNQSGHSPDLPALL